MAEHTNTAERLRLELVDEVQLLTTYPDPSFDALTAMAAATCNKPMALVSLVEETRQVFAARHGLALTETPRETSFCAHAIRACNNEQVFEVRDTHFDPRFRNNDLVVGPEGLRFYAGVPILPLGDRAVGTLCVLGDEPGELNLAQREDLIRLANIAEQLMRLRLLTAAKGALLEQLRASERELAETQFRRAHAVRSIAHDLATPLAAIRMTSESVGDQLSPSPVRTQVDHLIEFAREAESLVGDLRLVNDPDGEFPSLSPISQSLVPLVERSTTQLFGAIAPDHITLELDDVSAVVDEHAMTRVMNNLLNNAITHNPPGTPIVIRLSSQEDRSVLEVVDEGSGIPAADRTRMLEPYEALDSTGSGLGLAISDALVTAHGGTLVIDGNDPSGTIVSVTLPT